MNYLEIAGTVVGLIYLYLEYKVSIWLWVAGIVMPAIYIIVCYRSGLYADLAINVYYLIASAYGVACWWTGRGKSGNTGDTAIRHTPGRLYPRLATVFLVLFIFIAGVLIEFTDSDVPLADSFTTALSVVAMWMLAKKYVEQWLVWIVVDIVSVAMYVFKDLPFTAALYALYAAIALFGYRKWLGQIIKSSSN